ncbi:MAG: DUF459 domain-containing protein [Leptospiraceae bacterium]|nr:DUF459 domain-containing protein [Leptospiraceae bacterium]
MIKYFSRKLINIQIGKRKYPFVLKRASLFFPFWKIQLFLKWEITLGLRYINLCILIFELFFSLNCISRQIPIPKDRLIAKTFESKKLENKKIPYYIFFPNSYYQQPNQKYPLILFLHGRGERGNNLELLKRQALPKMIAEGNNEFPFILIAPQLPESKEEWYTNDLITFVDEIESDYSIDENRIYLTGISLGGNGVWKLATEFPNKFAAVVPISGWGDTSRICRLRNENVWAFHGAKDTLILPERTLEIVERLQYCNPNVKSTLYPNAKHDAWTDTYKNSDFMKWLLEQKRNQIKLKEDRTNQSKSPHTKINPLKIIVIGDSVGISISWGLNEFVVDNYHLTLDNFAKVSTGLSYPKAYNWNEKLSEFLAQKKYDLGIVLLGANDTQSISLDKEKFSLYSEAWRNEYKDRIRKIANQFLKAGMKLYWVELPPMGPTNYHLDTRYVNECFKEVAEELRFKYISTTFVLGDKKGNYQKYLTYKGKRTLMRADDDIHLTVVAAKLIVKEIMKEIFLDYSFLE